MARPKKSDAIDIPEQAITHVNTLLQNGQSSFSLNTIAKKIGCSAPALYAYFEGKDDLLEHVRRRAFLNLLAQKQQQYNNQAAPDPVQNLRNGGRYFIAFAQETPHLYQLIFMPKHQCKDSDINIIKTLLQPLIDGIHAAQPHALKQGIKADALAYLMWNSVQGAILMAMKNDTSFQWEQAYEVVETVMTLLFPTSSQ